MPRDGASEPHEGKLTKVRITQQGKRHMRPEQSVTQLLVDSIPEQGVLSRRPTRQFLRLAGMLAEILGDYARVEQEATSPPVSTRDRRGDRTSDLKSSLVGKGRDIKEFYRLYFQVRRERAEEMCIEIRRVQLRADWID